MESMFRHFLPLHHWLVLLRPGVAGFVMHAHIGASTTSDPVSVPLVFTAL